MIRKYTDCKIKLILSDVNNLFKVTYKKDYFSALGMIRSKIKFKNLILNDLLKQRLDLVKFNTNLKSTNLNDLDVNAIEYEEENGLNCDVLFFFTSINLPFDIKILKNGPNGSKFINISYENLILIFISSTESDKYELMSNFDHSFMCTNRITILFCLNNNPINEIALYDKINLICSNPKLMIGQFIQV